MAEHDITIYSLSTCIWCRKTKQFLKDSGLKYEAVDVDLLGLAEKEKVMDEIRKWNPSCSFPTVVINRKHCVVGFDPDKIKKHLKS